MNIEPHRSAYKSEMSPRPDLDAACAVTLAVRLILNRVNVILSLARTIVDLTQLGCRA